MSRKARTVGIAVLLAGFGASIAWALPPVRPGGIPPLLLDNDGSPQEDPICRDCRFTPIMEASGAHNITRIAMNLTPRASNTAAHVVKAEIAIYGTAGLLKKADVTAATGITSTSNGRWFNATPFSLSVNLGAFTGSGSVSAFSPSFATAYKMVVILTIQASPNYPVSSYLNALAAPTY